LAPPATSSAARKADGVAGDLLRRIVRGEIAPGELLPREADLAERYGVGRSVVREANKLLEVHRLVRPTRRRGTVALDPLGSVTPAVLRAMLVDRRGRTEPQMLAELLEIRALLDVRMTELAAERRDARDLAVIEASVRRIDATEAGSRAAFDAANAFGMALARATHNRIFVMLAHWHAEIALDLEPLLARVRAPVARQGAHRVLLGAIRDRDAALAGDLVAEFHRWANRRLIEIAREETDERRPRHDRTHR
jgi:DNA-binding FadR family transcriptional regulator